MKKDLKTFVSLYLLVYYSVYFTQVFGLIVVQDTSPLLIKWTYLASVAIASSWFVIDSYFEMKDKLNHPK